MAETQNAGGISLKILSTQDILALTDESLLFGEAEPMDNYDPLVAHITTHFGINRDAREEAGIDDDIFDSMRAFNGAYSAKDLARIRMTKGSEIFMNLTATKARAAKSWISDILKPTIGEPWSLTPTPVEDLPGDIRKMLTESLQKEFEEMAKSGQEPQAPPAPGSPPKSRTEETADKIREINQRKRDVEAAVGEEIRRESLYQLGRMERRICDQLKEGEWSHALSDFLDDFVVFPTSFIKGPITTRSKKLMWANGQVQEVDGYKFLNKRVHPIDMYPSPNAIGINEGNLIEHMRFDLASIEAMKGVEGYHDEEIDDVIEDFENGISGTWFTDTDIEQEKADLEKRGNLLSSRKGTIHGLHFWGNVKVSTLRGWDMNQKLATIQKKNDNDVVQIEAILVGDHVIKCALNDDPLQRRPYFKASFMNIPGAFWGKSLPMLMDSVQRMCNAVARALANNLGISSGPQISIYIDRLADDGAIEDITPFKIWQLRSDPTGAGGKAIDFWQPQSNAGELLKVYSVFEEKADDITGIPKYAYGNEKSSGMTQTAQGLAMLLETTSKIIKDCIRNIDEGLLIPRIMYQFHYNMLNLSDDFNYSGDINVVTLGSGTITLKGAESTKRNEFLQATANPTDQMIMGVEGRADILRKMAESLGLPNSIPTNFELKQKEKKNQEQQAQNQQAMAQAEQQKAQAGIQATTVQIEGQKAMHEGTMQEKMQKLQLDFQKHQDSMQLAMAELQRKIEADRYKASGKVLEEQNKENMQTQEIATKLKTGSGV